MLRRAVIEGSVRLRGMTVKAIDAEKIQISSAEDAFNARGAEVGSDLIINGAIITGGVTCRARTSRVSFRRAVRRSLVCVRTGPSRAPA